MKAFVLVLMMSLSFYGNSQCTNPVIGGIYSDKNYTCVEESVLISLDSSNLNDAQNWYWYEQSCGVGLIDSGSSILVNPGVTTTYYVRGEGGCVMPANCDSFTINVEDTVHPKIICRADTTVYLMPPPNAMTFNSIDPTVIENCPGYIVHWTTLGATNESGTGSISALPFSFGLTEVYYVVEDQSGNTDKCHSHVELIDESVGFTMNKKHTFSIFPNPTYGNLNIDLGRVYDEVQLELFNIQGQKLKAWSFIQIEKIEIQLPEHNGVYILIVLNNGTQSIFQVIKK